MKRPRYKTEFKAWVMQRIAVREKPVEALAAEVGVSASMIYRWQAAYLRDGTLGLERRQGRPRGGRRAVPSPAEEVRALRQKVGEQQLVIDFLAAACKRTGVSRRQSIGAGANRSTESSGR
ncbi:MAG TPA: helix-turn-helix domain-containing protein [Terriglobales bacterium]|nr:helix-turn-helix domain-containing protein [Terriglobales bacterium]